MYMRSIHDFGVDAGIFQVQFMLVHPGCVWGWYPKRLGEQQISWFKNSPSKILPFDAF